MPPKPKKVKKKEEDDPKQKATVATASQEVNTVLVMPVYSMSQRPAEARSKPHRALDEAIR